MSINDGYASFAWHGARGVSHGFEGCALRCFEANHGGVGAPICDIADGNFKLKRKR